MRGPGVRLDLDVRRVWRCPKCQRERRLAGDITAVRCNCGEGVWMQIVSERVAAQRAVTSMEARELTVASFNLTEEELSKPLPGRVRRRGPGPRTENAAGDVPPETGPASAERGSKEARGRGGNEPNAERPARKPKPPRAPKRPLSEIALLPDETRPPAEAAPKLESPEPSAGGDDFSAGIDLPATPPEN